MAPTSYEKHCQACHPLTFDLASGATVPHGLQPAEVRELLLGHYLSQVDQGKVRPKKWPPAARLVPDRLAEEEIALRTFLGIKVRLAERVLYLGDRACGLCHAFTTDADGFPTRVLPTGLQGIWFEHAAFDHTAHRAVDCRFCHKGAEQSTSSDNVLLPGITVCLECHAPPAREHATVRAGARTDCAECHRFHDGANPLAGRGSAARRPQEPVTRAHP
jgi:hypothetical protein